MKLQDPRNINWQRVYYHIKHNYISLNNGVMALAIVIAIVWAWGSISMMQRNYELQRKVDAKERELTLAQLEVETLEFQKRYYQSTEYQDLAARENFGLASPGEKVLNLPENSEAAKKVGTDTRPASIARVPAPSNMQQWIDFFSGRNVVE